MQSETKLAARFVLRAVAAGLIGACWLQPAVAVASSEQALDAAEAQAQATWRADIARIEVPAEGCFQAAYPNLYWEQAACSVAPHRTHSVPPKVNAADVVGDGHDYAASVSGLISQGVGSFPTVTGVTGEKSVGVPAFGDGGDLGPNEYTLQLNTNFTGTTAACRGNPGCVVWQQFIFATDQLAQGKAAVFIQYWLIGWGDSACPTGFSTDFEGDCFGNSKSVAAPDFSIKTLANMTLTGSAVAGGNDVVRFTNGVHSYSVSVKDSKLDIATVWNQAEFNVVGDGGGSRAFFNKGSSLTTELAVSYGSSAAPTCAKNAGTTGETNNLVLGPCTASGGATPTIEFTQSN
jgi:hypothetical protein